MTDEQTPREQIAAAGLVVDLDHGLGNGGAQCVWSGRTYEYVTYAVAMKGETDLPVKVLVRELENLIKTHDGDVGCVWRDLPESVPLNSIDEGMMSMARCRIAFFNVRTFRPLFRDSFLAKPEGQRSVTVTSEYAEDFLA